MKLNKDKLIGLFLFLIGLVIVGVIGYKVYLDFFQEKEEEVTIQRLELYGYSLEKSDKDIYKKYYEELTKVLNDKEIDYKKYSELLGKLYIIDFYTLNNKLSSTDIGALEFVHPDAISNFKLKASDTMYKYIEVNFDGKREQTLPEVSDVTLVSNEEGTKKLKEIEYPSYKIKYTWEYIEDLGYEKETTIEIIKDGTKLFVVGSD